MNTQIRKEIPTWDFVIQHIHSLYLPLMISIIIILFSISSLTKDDHFNLKQYSTPLIYVIIAVPLTMFLFIFLTIKINKARRSDFQYASYEATQLYLNKYPNRNTKKMNKFDVLKMSLKNICYFLNIDLLLLLINITINYAESGHFNITLFSPKDTNSYSILGLFISVQFLQLIILLYLTYRQMHSEKFREYRGMVIDIYNSEEAQKRPPYSRFWLYALPAIVSFFWLFIYIY